MSDINEHGVHAAGRAAAAMSAAGQPDTAATARGYVPRQASGYADVRGDGEPSGAALAMTIMAAVFMIITGTLGLLEGLAAVIKGSFYVVLPNYAFSMSATGWGVVHLILGGLVVVAGIALFTDHLWARIVGATLAAFMIVANFVYLPYYPVWAIVIIALNAFVIWALLTPRNR